MIKLLVFAVMLSFSLSTITFMEMAKATPIYTYTLRGPYFEDGTVPYNGTVYPAILWVNGSILRFPMTAIIHAENVTTFTSTSPAAQVIWNASTALNMTRVIDFMGATTEDVNLYIPSPIIPAGSYVFSISDFAGMNNPFLETRISIDGITSSVVERRSLNSTNTITFAMAQYGTYSLIFYSSNIGSFSQSFTAENIQTIQLPVLAGNFAMANATDITNFQAERLNESAIGMLYVDPSNTTASLTVTVFHISGTAKIIDHVVTVGSVVSWTEIWNGLESDKYYYAEAVTNSSYWSIPIGSVMAGNPFLGLWDWMGVHTPSLPVEYSGYPSGMTSDVIAQGMATFFILIVLAIGSVESAGVTCFLAWGIGGILFYLGWWAPSIPIWVFAGFISALIIIDEAKARMGGVFG